MAFSTPVSSNDRYCHINSERGYGDQQFVIVTYGSRECKLRDSGGRHFDMFTAHLHTTAEDRNKSKTEKRAAADSIGMPKAKPGKR